MDTALARDCSSLVRRWLVVVCVIIVMTSQALSPSSVSLVYVTP